MLNSRSRAFRLFTSALLLPLFWSAPAFCGPDPSSSFDPGPWLEDFHQLLHEMSSHYANLEWAVNDRHMDLPHLRAETEDALRHAHEDAEARRFFARFLESFGDGHLELDWPAAANPPAPASSNAETGLCERLGYQTRGKPGIDYSLLSGFTPMPGPQKLFPGGLLKLPGARVFGVIRIGIFTEKGFPDACGLAIRQIGIAANGAACDEACADKIQLATANILTKELTTQAEALRRAGASALLIDITRNGGGSDWADAPPRALSSKPLRDPQLWFVKGEHWTRQLEATLKNVEADLHDGRGPAEALREATRTLERVIAASKQSCDAEGVWATGKLDCSILVKNLQFASGVLPYAPPGSFAGFKSGEGLFQPSQYFYTEASGRLPLYVLVDKDTWSAAEYFAAILEDNHAAVVIGEPTGGAGCGYTDGGIPTELKNSKAEVRMPDCVRIRADGSDEVNGITPDVLVPWTRHDSPYQRSKTGQGARRAAINSA